MTRWPHLNETENRYGIMILRICGKSPQISSKASAVMEERKHCPDCQAPMRRRPDQFRQGKFWWGCTAYPQCKYTEKER